MLVLIAPALQAAELVQPLPDSTVFEWDVQIVIKGAAREVVNLTVDGQGYAAQPVTADDGSVYWHAVVQVQRDGRHTIRVGGSFPSSYTFNAGDRLTSGRKGWKQSPFHGKDRSAGCLTPACHSDQTESDPEAVAQACTGCHQYQSEFAHAPARKGLCFRCHKQNGEGLWDLVGSPNEQCRYCHEEPFGRMSRAAYIHGPVNLGDCTLCHDPHASAKNMVTRRGSNNTCVFCHDGYDKKAHLVAGFYASSVGKRSAGHPVANFEDTLDPQMELRCASCHSPHEAENQQQFAYKKTKMMELCRLCHEGKF